MDLGREQRRRFRRRTGTAAHIAFYVLAGGAVICAMSPSLFGAPLELQRFAWLLVGLAAVSLLVGYAALFWSIHQPRDGESQGKAEPGVTSDPQG